MRNAGIFHAEMLKKIPHKLLKLGNFTYLKSKMRNAENCMWKSGFFFDINSKIFSFIKKILNFSFIWHITHLGLVISHEVIS